MKNLLKPIVLFVVLSNIFGTLQASDAVQFIAKSRELIGKNSALEGIQTLQYEGVLIDAEGKNQGRLLMQFKKPFKQKVTHETDTGIEITASNGHEGYQMFISKDGVTPRKLGVLTHDKVQMLVINAIENLYFFNGYLKRGGRLLDEGQANFLGKPARKFIFRYPSGVDFERYFDPNSAELLGTLSSEGVLNREVEYQQIKGIRFPKKLVASKDGKELYTIVFDKIEVNPEILDQVFEFPSLRGAQKVEKN